MKINKLEERLKEHAQITKSIISAPFDLKTEINKMEVNNMIKPKNITWLKRVGTIAAVVTICAVTVVSAGAVKGFFKDVTRWDGAITGTEYVDATNDIKIDILETNDEFITLDIKFSNPSEAPFSFIQELAIAEYIILDKNNNEVLTVNSDIENSLITTIKNDEVLIKLPIKDINLNANNIYTLEINTIYGLAKAEQPLKITGNWKCEFIR